jgi:hypothetical protein
MSMTCRIVASKSCGVIGVVLGTSTFSADSPTTFPNSRNVASLWASVRPDGASDCLNASQALLKKQVASPKGNPREKYPHFSARGAGRSLTCETQSFNRHCSSKNPLALMLPGCVSVGGEVRSMTAQSGSLGFCSEFVRSWPSRKVGPLFTTM